MNRRGEAPLLVALDQVQDPRTEVTVTEARRYNPLAEMGQMVVVESTPRDFGRVAAQTARQVIQQRIRDAERQAQLSFYDKQVGEIVRLLEKNGREELL